MLSRAERTACLAILTLAAVVTLYPLVTLLSTALTPKNGSAGGISFSLHLSLSAFAYAWRSGDFSAYMLNTAIVTVAVVVIATVIAVPAGYAIALAKPPGARWVLYTAVFGF